MIYLDLKFLCHLITCMEMQEVIHLQPLKKKIEWQERINKTIAQCKVIVEDAKKEEQRAIRKKALHIIPDSSLFDSTFERFEE